jgi:ATP-binding cassette subfamily B protein
MFSKLRFLLRYTHKFRWWYTGGIIFLGLTIYISITIPGYLQKSIDLITAGSTGSNTGFYNYVFIMLALALVLIVVRSFSRILFFVPGRLIEKQLKGEMFNKLTSFGKDYYDLNTTGSIISRINNDINGVRMITGFGMLQVGNILFSLSITPYKMWQLSPTLTLYTIIPLVVVFTVVRFGMVAMVKNTHSQMDALQQLSGRIISYLSGSGVIKSYNMHRWAEEKVQEKNISNFKYTLKIAWIRSYIMPLLKNLEEILKIVVLLVGGLYVIQGKFTLGQLTEYIAYATLLTQPIMGLGWVLTVFQQGFVGIASLQTIMNRKGADDQKQPLPLKVKEALYDQGIRATNLTYTYHDGQHPVLKNISLTIKPGEVVGITGPVGSGKSTLINCLNGYLKVDAGQLFLGQHDASQLRGKEIRNVIRTVSQEVFLFSDTIENNVSFGSEKYENKKTLKQVIYQSAFSSELERFPLQEKTLVGEKGIMLSGGQKQRISLARALYTPCKLLILDDVFSAVDTDTERFLIKQIFGKGTAQSMLVISNRISVLEQTDKIIVLHEGEVVASGTHQELIQSSPFYRETAKLQDHREEEED